MRRRFFIALTMLLPALVQAAAEKEAFFRDKVAPALSAKCIKCHNPGNAKGKLDLSTRELMLKGGKEGETLTPGKPDDSAVWSRSVPHDGEKPEMPKKGDPLTAEEAAALREWIAAGAEWPAGLVLQEKAKADRTFWSFQPLLTTAAPAAEDAPAGWRENPIDGFVFDKLREKNLAPNPPAEPRELIRRMTYDLHGLPPTPEEVAAFEQAARIDRAAATKALIERLLASPRYGEQWGRHWLDVVRFGESRGYERNQIITNLWPFRDYVIRSFNEDRPFDQMVREHLAGDVIGRDQPEVEVGSAFLVAGPYDDVGNKDPAAAAQIRADTIDEMIRATSESFLGLTIGCARCHDHKFDPLTQRDYYGLYATLAGVVHGEREVGTRAEREARAAKVNPLEDEKNRIAAERDALKKDLAARAKAAEAEAAKAWTRPRPSRYGTEEKFTPVEAKLVRLRWQGTDLLEDKRAVQLEEFEVWSAGAAPQNVALATAGGKAKGATREPKDFKGAYGVELVNDGKFGARWHPAANELVIELAAPTEIERVFFSTDLERSLPETNSYISFVGDYTIDVSADGKTWREVASSADREPINAARKQQRLLGLVTTSDDKARLAALDKDLARLDRELAAIPPLQTWWLGTRHEEAGPFQIFTGGNPQRKAAEVTPASLTVFSGTAPGYELGAKSAEAERRLALANWLTEPENPLTPRVLANRLWHYHFGRGLVGTPSDFGYMGERPTHPELLDFLARELHESGWQLKPLHRLILSSQTYQQSSAHRADAARIDGDAQLLWRFPPRRLSAEEVRDTVLAISGKLDLTMGGPGFKLYEYQQDNVATYVPLDTHGPETYRRAVYHQNARAARVDMLTDFDCPDPAGAEPRRAATVTPIQALTMMNHRFSLDMAEALAERLQPEAGPVDAATQVRRAFELAFSRAPAADELTRAIAVIEQHGLRTFCRALLNTSELIQLN
jgi:mono/diheme cytochrome c family protein